MRRISILLMVILLSSFLSKLVFAAQVNDAAIKIKWGYKGNIGPERWGQLDPAFMTCATGKSQSPINIGKKVKNKSARLTIQYQPAPMVIMNDGVTDLELGNVQTIVNEGHGIQLNFPSDQFPEWITFDDKRYRLVQFHIHTPSENEWHGQSFPMEIHFVHQGENGQVVVIGVFVKAGESHPILQKIINNLPLDKGKEHAVTGETISPRDLMPVKSGYYSFIGSLTTPPCIEGVQWILMSETLAASPAQIVMLRKVVGGSNARPVQPLNNRKVSVVVN